MFKVFPAHLNNERQKVPLISNWKNLASNDPKQIQAWQAFFKNKITFWGAPCGSVNNILVLDIDIKTDGWKTIQEHKFNIPDTLSQKTLSGGRHFIFQFDPSRDPGNRVGFLPGLDIRSEGGWIAWYGLETDFTKPILPAPEWLYEAALSKKETKPLETQSSTIKLAPEIAEGMFKTSIDTIINAPPGESNDTLNVESFKVGRLVACGNITREFAEAELFKAAKQRGKPDYEARATIKSGLDGGIKNPLTSPFPNAAPVAAFEIPEAPKPPERWTPRRLTRSDLLNTSKLKKPQLFQDWSAEDITITTADGGTGKTTMKLFEAICLALGDRFLGFENKQRGKTLYITGEDTEEKLAAMVGQIMRQMGILDNEEKVNTVLDSIVIKKDADLCLIQKDKQMFLHPNSDAMRKLKEAVDDIRPKMIVFDPIASFWGSEQLLNDMNKAVTKFMSWLVEYSGAAVEMINHMGKSSSQAKDMSQFAGRGGSGLPSNSRISRVLHGMTPEEYTEYTGTELVGDQTAILCNVNKFSDGSVLFNKPFIIIREGYLFSRATIIEKKAQELEKQMGDSERVFTFIKEQRNRNKFPTKHIAIAHFANCGDPIPKSRVERALNLLAYDGHMGEKLTFIENPDVTIGGKAFVITDMEGKELS